MDKYQWTCTGMATSDSANGPMRYIREVDYDALQATIDELKYFAQSIIDHDWHYDSLDDAVRFARAALKESE